MVDTCWCPICRKRCGNGRDTWTVIVTLLLTISVLAAVWSWWV